MVLDEENKLYLTVNHFKVFSLWCYFKCFGRKTQLNVSLYLTLHLSEFSKRSMATEYEGNKRLGRGMRYCIDERRSWKVKQNGKLKEGRVTSPFSWETSAGE